MSATPDTAEVIRSAMEKAFADWWTDFEDDHPPGYSAKAVRRFVDALSDEGYAIVQVPDLSMVSSPLRASWLREIASGLEAGRLLVSSYDSSVTIQLLRATAEAIDE